MSAAYEFPPKRSPKRFYGHMNFVIAEMIRELYFLRLMNQTQLAAFFRIGQGTVSRIVSNQVWRRPATTNRQTAHECYS